MIARIGTWRNSANTAATSINVTFLLTPQPGDLLVACHAVTTPDANVGVPAGWSVAVAQDRGATMSCRILYRVAQAGDTDITITSTGAANHALAIAAYTGAAKTAPLDAAAGTDGGAGSITSLALSPVTTTALDDLLIAMIGVGSSLPAGNDWLNTWTGGFASTTATTRMETAEARPGVTGSDGTTETWQTARVACGAIAAFKAQPGVEGWGIGI